MAKTPSGSTGPLNEPKPTHTPAEPTEPTEPAAAPPLPPMPPEPAPAPPAINPALMAMRTARLGGLIDLIRNLGPNIGVIIDLLRGINIGKLGALLAAVRELMAITSDITTKEGIIARVEAGLRVARVWVEITPGDADDGLLLAIDKIVGDPDTLAWIADVIARLLSNFGVKADPVALTAQAVGDIWIKRDDELATAKGIAWDKIVPLVKLLFELISAFLAKKPA